MNTKGDADIIGPRTIHWETLHSVSPRHGWAITWYCKRKVSEMLSPDSISLHSTSRRKVQWSPSLVLQPVSLPEECDMLEHQSNPVFALPSITCFFWSNNGANFSNGRISGSKFVHYYLLSVFCISIHKLVWSELQVGQLNPRYRNRVMIIYSHISSF